MTVDRERAMLSFNLVTIGLLGTFCLAVSADHLDDVLHYYETLHSRDIGHHPIKRSVEGCQKRTISFTTLGREFLLHLRCQTGLLTPDFKAFAEDETERKIPLSVDTSGFYQGYVDGQRGSSKVLAHYEGTELMATIATANNTYVVEPSSPHLPESSQYNMIAYRVSDLKLEMANDPDHHMGRSYCGFVHPDGDDAAYVEPDDNAGRQRVDKQRKVSDRSHWHRRRRALASGVNTCPVALVADYTFYDVVGQGSEATTAAYLINHLAQVDQIYRSTTFGEGYTGLGFEIAEIVIHTAPTKVSDGQTHYNMEVATWATNPLLRAFGSGDTWKNYCLAHLFTARAFENGVLGLAWVASPASNVAGGICSPRANGNYYNTGWSSTINTKGSRILSQELVVVTAHEFGHNWGSQHDGASSACSPGSSNGGNYIMYQYAVSGFDPNNKKFSPCSTTAIDLVLDSKAGRCFTERSASYCGNSKVEEGEECDAGATDNDPCCNEDCELKSGAVCSDVNTECCKSCQVAPSTVQCRSTGDLITSCEEDGFCSGFAVGCPESASKPDGTGCVDNGQCIGGVCQSFCARQGLLSCACTEVEFSCKWCCRASEEADCVPYLPDANSDYIDLPDGKQCVQGLCDSGTCEKSVQQLTDRLWDVINHISINSFWRWVKDNIVISVMFLSLIIYIPLCIIVACVDWKESKQDEKERSWHNRDNDELVLESDRHRIRNTPHYDNHSRSPARRGTTRSRNRPRSVTSTSRIQIDPI